MKFGTEEVHLLDYWRTLLKRRNAAIAFFAVVFGATAIYSFLATPVYQGSTQILVDLEKNATMSFAEGGGAYLQMKDSGDYFRTQKEILASRAFADRVVRKMQIDKNPYYLKKKDDINSGFFRSVLDKVKGAIKSLFPDRVKKTDGFTEAQLQQELDPDLTDIILDEMGVEIGKQNNLMKIQYNSEDPLVAAVMANGVADAYIEHNLEIRVKPFRDAVEWLSSRMVELRGRVETSEKSLQRYKEGQGIVSFDAKENVITQKLGELVSQMVVAQGARAEAEVRYNQIKSVIDNPELLATVPDVANNLVIQGLRNDELTIKKNISELSDKYGPKHPQMIKKKSELEMTQRNLIAEARKMLDAAKISYEISRSRETSIGREIDDQKKEVLLLSQKAIDFNVLAGESDSNKQFYELLLKKLQEASLSSGINISNSQVIDGAVVAKMPLRPRKALNMALAVVVGLIGGVIAAMFVEYMDDSIKSADEVEKILGLPFLGMVPASKEEGPIYMQPDAKNAVAESYRGIRTGILLSSVDVQPKVLLVTSTTPAEGKTTTAANLAVAMSQMGEKVLLIDVDMRRHNVHELFNLDNTVGISDMIVNHGDLSGAIKAVPGIPGLSVITGGTLAPNPAELLASSRMKDIIVGLRGNYDRIILDSPPLLIFSDPLILSRLADGTILVVWGGATSKDLITKVSQSLKGVNVKLLGVVLNKVMMAKRSGYGYGYSYSYYHYYDSYYGKKQKRGGRYLSRWFGK
ncbi:MAG: polysaccharide biosynthesis tyrosine autokinase [Deltaproteobacteria bacterium]|nr:polysaccharide biosynthesis tyrosine autokinase [Deltaproteobacteria bacterium]